MKSDSDVRWEQFYQGSSVFFNFYSKNEIISLYGHSYLWSTLLIPWVALECYINFTQNNF